MEVNYDIVASNSGAIKNNISAQRQFAAWLVQFGLEVGTIKNPLESDVKQDASETSVYVLRQEKVS